MSNAIQVTAFNDTKERKKKEVERKKEKKNSDAIPKC